MEKAKNLFVTGYEKMQVSQDFELRKVVRGAGGSIGWLRTIWRRRLRGYGAEEVLKDLRGMTSIAYTFDDPVALAKALTAYAKTNPPFTFKAGIVEGRVIDVSRSTTWRRCRRKEEIFAKLLFLINAPAQRLVSAINGVGRNLAVVVDQGVKENKFQLKRSERGARSDYSKEFKKWRTSTQLQNRFKG